jgi:hypothetical protein
MTPDLSTKDAMASSRAALRSLLMIHCGAFIRRVPQFVRRHRNRLRLKPSHIL